MHIAGHKQRPPLHPLEKALLWTVGLHLVLLPWVFAGRDMATQCVSAGLSVLEFALALWPRRYREHLAPAGDFDLSSWPRLVRFPPFWLGLALLAYLGAQWLNPAWEFRQNPKVWWMQPLSHVEWLPSGCRAPFERFNVAREALISGAAWLTVCAAWVGFTRRKSLQVLSGLLVVNAVVLAIVGFAHRLSGDMKVLWVRDLKSSPFASFAYQNHAGTYFGLIAALGLGLMVWHIFEGRKRMARSTPAAVWGILTVALIFAVLFSFSRGAVITLVFFAVGALLAFWVVRAANPVRSTTPRLVNALMILAFAGTVLFLVREVDFSVLEKRFSELATLKANDPSLQSRVAARTAAWDMYERYWLLGAGAGSFQYLFPTYIKRFPEYWQNGNLFWRHAHIDWLEIPIELGLPGVLLIAAAFGWAVRRFLVWRGWRHPVAVMVLLGCGQTLLHAAIDFPFQNVAVFMTWWAMLFVTLRWLEIDRASDEAKSVRH